MSQSSQNTSLHCERRTIPEDGKLTFHQDVDMGGIKDGVPCLRAAFLAAFVAGFRADRFFSSSFRIPAMTAFCICLARLLSFLEMFLVAIRLVTALVVEREECRTAGKALALLDMLARGSHNRPSAPGDEPPSRAVLSPDLPALLR